jgi:hypothetical protein
MKVLLLYADRRTAHNLEQGRIGGNAMVCCWSLSASFPTLSPACARTSNMMPVLDIWGIRDSRLLALGVNMESMWMTTEYLKITIIGRLGCQDPNHKSFISDYVRRLISFPRFLLSALIFSVFLLPKTLLLMKMRFLHSLSLFSFLGVATPHTIFTQSVDSSCDS